MFFFSFPVLMILFILYFPLLIKAVITKMCFAFRIASKFVDNYSLTRKEVEAFLAGMIGILHLLKLKSKHQ